MKKRLVHTIPALILVLLAVQVGFVAMNRADAAEGDILLVPAAVEPGPRDTTLFIDVSEDPAAANGAFSIDLGALTVADLEVLAAPGPGKNYMAGNKNKANPDLCECPVTVGNCVCVVTVPK